MDEKTCNEKMKAVVESISRNEGRLNTHSNRIKELESNMISIQKDTIRLEEILDKLERTVERLNLAILDLKHKPLKYYEQIVMFIVTGVLGYLLAYLFKK